MLTSLGVYFNSVSKDQPRSPVEADRVKYVVSPIDTISWPKELISLVKWWCAVGVGGQSTNASSGVHFLIS